MGKIGMGKTYHPSLQAELPVALSEVWILEDYCRGLEVFRGPRFDFERPCVSFVVTIWMSLGFLQFFESSCFCRLL